MRFWIVVFSLAAAHAASFEDVHVVKLPAGRFGYRGMPGDITVLRDGRLLLAYTSQRPEGSIAARYSSDQGRSWGDEVILVRKPDSKEYFAHPSFLRLPNGHLLLSYIYNSGAEPRFGGNYYRRSTDDGKTWSDQFIVTPATGYQLMHNNKLIRLSTGRVIAPVEFELTDEEKNDHRGYVSLVFYSDDGGYSWNRSTNVVNALPVEAQEPHVVELGDGRLMMLCRTYSGYVLRSYSADKGQSWSAPEHLKDLSLPPNSSAMNVQRIPGTGDLLLLRSSGGRNRLRTPLVSAISKDEGRTWIHERVLGGDPEDDYGYPSLLFLDEVALVSYHRRDGLHVARIPVKWFSARE